MVTAPDPPYLYDDPRFIYDEPCLFYDGGFSVICLINLEGRLFLRKVGKSTSFQSVPQKKEEEDCRTILDIMISVAPSKVNNTDIKWPEIVKKYHMDYGPITVSVNRAKHEQDEVNVHMQALTSSITIPKICITDRNVKLLPIRTIVSSSLSRIKKSKVIIKTESIKKK